jgi:hypothetical protein
VGWRRPQAVSWLPAEAGEVAAGTASEHDENYGTGGATRPMGGGSALLKGAVGTRVEGGGVHGVGRHPTRGAERGRVRGARAWRGQRSGVERR